MDLSETTAENMTIAELAGRLADHDDAAVRVLARRILKGEDVGEGYDDFDG